MTLVELTDKSVPNITVVNADTVVEFYPDCEGGTNIWCIGNHKIKAKESYDEVKKALTGDIDIPKRVPYFSAEELECALIDERKRNECEITRCATCKWNSSNVNCKYEILADYINRKLKGVNDNDNN